MRGAKSESLLKQVEARILGNLGLQYLKAGVGFDYSMEGSMLFKEKEIKTFRRTAAKHLGIAAAHAPLATAYLITDALLQIGPRPATTYSDYPYEYYDTATPQRADALPGYYGGAMLAPNK